VEITDYFIEGFIHESRLPADVYKHDEKSHQLKGRRTGRAFRLGDPLRVIVSSASIEKRQVDFDLVESKPARKR
jgi:ribonuclease R